MTYNEFEWVWQSVYFASISSVLVGPTTWYSSVPTMHQLSSVSIRPKVWGQQLATYFTVL